MLGNIEYRKVIAIEFGAEPALKVPKIPGDHVVKLICSRPPDGGGHRHDGTAKSATVTIASTCVGTARNGGLVTHMASLAFAVRARAEPARSDVELFLVSPIRQCSRTNCRESAVATMTYGYKEATAVIGPLSPIAQPGAFDLCMEHAHSVTVPVGWQMVRLVTEFEPVEPSDDDLTALADAIREASRREVAPPQPARREVRRPATDLSTPPTPRPRFAVIPGLGDEPDGDDAGAKGETEAAFAEDESSRAASAARSTPLSSVEDEEN